MAEKEEKESRASEEPLWAKLLRKQGEALDRQGQSIEAAVADMQKQGQVIEKQGQAIEFAVANLKAHEERFQSAEKQISELKEATVGQEAKIAQVGERVAQLERNNLNEKIDGGIAGVREFV